MNITRIAAGCAIGLAILLDGCSETPTAPADTSVADQKALRDGEVAWTSDFASRDVDRIVSHYADDASLMLPDSPLLKGKEAIRAAVKEMEADKNLAVVLTTTSANTSKSGDLAYTTGTYSLTATNPKTHKPATEQGKYVTVYRKQADQTWKAVADIINADAPAVAAKTAVKARKAAPVARRRKK